MAKGKKEKTEDVKIDEPVQEAEAPVVEAQESDEVLALRKEVADLKAVAETKANLEIELEELKAASERKGGKPISLKMGTYRFTNILDPGVSFTGTHGHPKTVGGRNAYTRYCCDNGATVELPVIYAEELNMCRIPEPRWERDPNGNSLKVHSVTDRWIFTKVETDLEV